MCSGWVTWSGSFWQWGLTQSSHVVPAFTSALRSSIRCFNLCSCKEIAAWAACYEPAGTIALWVFVWSSKRCFFCCIETLLTLLIRYPYDTWVDSTQCNNVNPRLTNLWFIRGATWTITQYYFATPFNKWTGGQWFTMVFCSINQGWRYPPTDSGSMHWGAPWPRVSALADSAPSYCWIQEKGPGDHCVWGFKFRVENGTKI